ncbi:MAG: NYN domain-containing protein [Elusimicrobiota bacterium]
MSLHYILDGNNILHLLGVGSREELIEYMISRKPQGSDNNTVTIVFDGAPRYEHNKHGFANVHVLYSFETKADDIIIKKLKEIVAARKWQEVIVITNDNGLGRQVKLHGGTWSDIASFITKKQKPVDKQVTAKNKAQIKAGDKTTLVDLDEEESLFSAFLKKNSDKIRL